jgi:transcriptional regulator with XRE-family HTH domain
VIENEFSTEETAKGSFTPANMTLEMQETGEQTIQRILSTYDIGHKLRQLRLKKKIALVDLGRHTGLSASMLSQLETGKMIPTLPTLARIAMVFDVGLDYFFDDRRHRKTFTVVRKDERLKFPDRPDAKVPTYFFECLAFSAQEKGLQAYFAEFPGNGGPESPPHHHDGAEFIFVTQGELIINCHGEDHSLAEGDSVYFDSSEPHSYRGGTLGSAQAVVITTPVRS